MLSVCVFYYYALFGHPVYSGRVMIVVFIVVVVVAQWWFTHVGGWWYSVKGPTQNKPRR